jgi:hypothetical protein
MKHYEVAIKVTERKITELELGIASIMKPLKKHANFMNLEEWRVADLEEAVYHKCVELKKLESQMEYFKGKLS